ARMSLHSFPTRRSSDLDSLGIPPSETTKKISVDPITGTEIFDVNTVAVIPGPRASGYVSPQITNMDITHSSGIGNGDFNFKILKDRKSTRLNSSHVKIS